MSDASGFRDVLLGGLVGALLATGVQVWFERRKADRDLKRELMRDVLHWMSETFHHMSDLWNHDVQGEGELDYLTEDEWRHIRHDLSRLMTPAVLRARVADLYGERSRQFQVVDAFVDEVVAFMKAFTTAGAGATPDPRSERLARAMADVRRAFLGPLRGVRV